MKFIYNGLLTAIASMIAAMFLPWWCIAPIAFISSMLIVQTPFKAFLSGFLAIFLLWVIQSYLLSSGNHHILAHKLSILIVKMDRPPVLFFVTGLIGGLVAGFASLTAAYLRKAPKNGELV